MVAYAHLGFPYMRIRSMHEDDKLGICRIPGHCDWRTVRTCHSEPVRTLVWESPSNFGLPIVIQTVLLHRFPEFIHEKLCFYPGDCHASVRYFIAMTGKSAARQIPNLRTTERYRAGGAARSESKS